MNALPFPVDRAEFVKRAAPNKPLTHLAEFSEEQTREMREKFPRDFERLERARLKRERRNIVRPLGLAQMSGGGRFLPEQPIRLPS
jgi:hypothetical protein